MNLQRKGDEPSSSVMHFIRVLVITFCGIYPILMPVGTLSFTFLPTTYFNPSCLLLKPTLRKFEKFVLWSGIESAVVGGDNDDGGSDDEEPPLKLITDNTEDMLKDLSRKYPTSSIDYLAAAKQRAEEARASVEGTASDEDWNALSSQVAVEKRNREGSDGNLDGWEASLADAGNAESQILIPYVSGEENGEDENGNEGPKLLLF